MATRDGVPFPMRCRIERLPVPVAEYHFALELGRAWRFDWAWPRHRVALEVDGGIWTSGRHTRGKGFRDDMVKLNTAAVEGWCVIRCIPQDLMAETTFTFLRRAFAMRRE